MQDIHLASNSFFQAHVQLLAFVSIKLFILQTKSFPREQKPQRYTTLIDFPSQFRICSAREWFSTRQSRQNFRREFNSETLIAIE